MISVGADNPYGHPTAATLATLDAAGVPVARTDLDGEVEIDVDAGSWSVRTLICPGAWRGDSIAAGLRAGEVTGLAASIVALRRGIERWKQAAPRRRRPSRRSRRPRRRLRRQTADREAELAGWRALAVILGARARLCFAR